MLNSLSLSKNLQKSSFSLASLMSFLSSTYKITDIKHHYLYIIEDNTRELSFLREIQTSTGEKGIVLKISEFNRTYVAMYEPIKNEGAQEVTFTRVNIDWKQTFNGVLDKITEVDAPLIFDVNGSTIFQGETRKHSSQLQKSPPSKPIPARRLSTSNPILDVCYDLAYGNLIHFSGCLGSRKTSTVESIFQNFGQKKKHIGLYMNSHSESENKRITSTLNHTYCFNNGSVDKLKQTDVGVYMLALKTIVLANNLKEKGYDVLLTIDNFKHVLNAEWSMLQSLHSTEVNDGRKKIGGTAQHNSLKISPISILNEIYSSCMDQMYLKKLDLKSKSNEGSFTSIIVSDKEGNDELTPELTPYSNNFKHLASLCEAITFPLSIKINSNKNSNGRLTKDQDQKEISLEQYYRLIRQGVNSYLMEKNYSELRRKLYKDQLRDSPWDYYNMFDSEWWIKGLSEIRPANYQQSSDFIKWIGYNLEESTFSQWKISALKGFEEFNKYLASKQLAFTKESFVEFISWARMQDLFSVFKKDYHK